MMNEKTLVFLEKCSSYSRDAMLDVIEKLAEYLQLSGKISGRKILLKPNLVSAKGNSLACTNPYLLVALAHWCKEQGARVSIGDSPAFGNATGVLKKLGVFYDLTRMGIDIRDFSHKKNMVLTSGATVGVATAALECDLFINVPKVKAHSQMYVTLAMKNVFGIISGLKKPLLHMQYGENDQQFARVIVDLLKILPENITFIDGLEVMHRSGPINGESLNLNCIAAGNNPVAIDSAFMHLLELDSRRSPLLQEAKARNLPGSRFSELSFPHLSPAVFYGSGFEAPLTLDPVRFSPFRFVSSHIKRIALKVIP